MNELSILLTASASIAFFHTLIGPDHYLPFVMMSRAGRWSLRKTIIVTILCGAGHVMGSVVLGMLGVVLGIAVSKIEAIESFRGDLAVWALIVFGLVYFVWGIRKAMRSRPHEHPHAHEDNVYHTHVHSHTGGHLHIHGGGKRITPWMLFIVFILGPCEPLIPLLMYPAARHNAIALLLVTLVFAVITVLTMLGIVILSTIGINILPTNKLERYIHAIAGALVSLCGISILVFGL